MKRSFCKRNKKGNKKVEVEKTRKELRKEQRIQKKIRKHNYFSQKNKKADHKLKDGSFNKATPYGHVQELHHKPDSNHAANVKGEVKNDKNTAVKIKDTTDRVRRMKSEEEAMQRKLQEEIRKTHNVRLQEENEEEDKIIKKLEKQLKLNKRKSKSVPKSFKDDGLDYILDMCNEDKMQHIANLEHVLHDSDSEFEKDLAIATGAFDTENKNILSPEKKKQKSISDKRKNCSKESDSIANQDHSFDLDNEMYHDDTANSTSDSNSSAIDEGECILGNDDLSSDDNHNTDNEDIKHARNNIKYDSDDIGSDASDFDNYDYSDVDDNSQISKYQTTNKENIQLKNPKTNIKRKRSDMEIGTVQSDSICNDNSIKKKQKTTLVSEESCEPGKYVRLKKSATIEPELAKEFGDSTVQKKNVQVNTEETESTEKEDIWEDIYGRLRDKKGNILTTKGSKTGSYVPPALRAQNAESDNSAILKRLQRQVKGPLNRLTQSNMVSICNEIEQLFNNNSRHNMNETFADLVFKSLIGEVITLERLIMEHAVLISCLHAKVGSDVGAFILQKLAKMFDSLFKEAVHEDIESKQLDNVIYILCHLHNFKVVHARLILNILQKLTERFGPKDIELILVILRTVGFSLRQKEPVELKIIIQELQQKANKEAQKGTMESRVKFMLEALLAVKNNNVQRMSGCNPESVDQLRKLLRALTSTCSGSSELNISLDDLLLADERGRWWVVGSAWAGQAPGRNGPENSGASGATPSYSTQLLELARQQRMNTDVRRNIFCILMTAQDYHEAFDNLLKLGLKGPQAREVIHVTLDCCLQEKAFNKYYSHILQIFCDYDRTYRMTLQFNIWDKFRELKTLNSVQTNNLTQLLLYLLKEGGLTLSVFKVFDLADLEKTAVRVMRQVLLALLAADWETCELTFSRISRNSKLHSFCSSLRVFLHHFVLGRLSENDPRRASIQERVDRIDNLLVNV